MLEFAKRLLDDFPQGTLTLILDAHEPLTKDSGVNELQFGFLLPTARALAETVGPVTATSANKAGIPPLSDAESAGLELNLSHDSILAGTCQVAKAVHWSRCTNHRPHLPAFSVRIMREGVIPATDVNLWMSKNR